MRTLLLAGAASASALVLSALLGTASATTIGFTSQIVNYTAPNTGIYYISATGAEGGTEPYTFLPDAYGARGEGVRAYFDLTAGEVLRIAVGGTGGNGPGSGQYGAAGGGGGTFVIGPNNTPLLIAGGGGGGGAESGSDGVAPSGLNATNGASGSGSGGSAGSNGSGGGAGGGIGTGGGGGGGFLGSGGSSSGAAGGSSFANGLGGGGSGTLGGGGFGGGGAGRQGSQGGGGGGGGYNGGGGGGGGTAIDGRGSTSNGGGGSGGSFIGSSDPDLPSYFDPPGFPSGVGNGLVTIYDLTGLGSPAPVPEPATLALFGTGLAGLGLIRRRRRG